MLYLALSQDVLVIAAPYLYLIYSHLIGFGGLHRRRILTS